MDGAFFAGGTRLNIMSYKDYGWQAGSMRFSNTETIVVMTLGPVSFFYAFLSLSFFSQAYCVLTIFSFSNRGFLLYHIFLSQHNIHTLPLIKKVDYMPACYVC